MDKTRFWSRLQGFFKLSMAERRALLSGLPLGLKPQDFFDLDAGLCLKDADAMSENVVGSFSLPLSVAANFIVDNQPVLVPMVTEEPSIVAACSKMAKIVAEHGGFKTTVARSLLRGQIQLYRLLDGEKALQDFEHHKEELLAFANRYCPGMVKRGGGVISLDARLLSSPKLGPMLLIEPVMDVVDAMGANAMNTVLEALGEKISTLFLGTMGLRILSNLTDQRLAKATCAIPYQALSLDATKDFGRVSAEKMFAAHVFAEADVYRACTHNKGILNGIDAVAIATGNDFRALEAGAHAFASLAGRYQPLTTLALDSSHLCAELTLPLAVGVVGGMTAHQGVRFAHKILGNFSKSAQALASVMASVGLAQCLAALFALSHDGIQKGHMKLHQKKSKNLSTDESC